MAKKQKKSIARRSISLLLVIVMIWQGVTLAITPKQSRASEVPHGPLKRVVVTYRGQAATATGKTDVADQAEELAKRQDWLVGALQYAEGYKKVAMSYSQLPIVVMDVDAEGEASLKANPNVVSVKEDTVFESSAIDFQYTPDVLDGDPSTGFSDGTDNFTGAGTAVVVLDSGVDKAHEALTGQVVSEACYGVNQTYSNAIVASACPGAVTATTASGSGVPCETACDHGTEVASTIAMKAATMTSGSDSFNTSGVAKGAKIVAIQVNAKITEIAGQGDLCGDTNNTSQTCYNPLMSLVLAGMNRALELQNANTLGVPIVAVNDSNGVPTKPYSDAAACAATDTDGLNVAAAALKAKNIATINSAGNSGASASHYNKVTYPACLSNFIAVSASSANNKVSYYSNAGPLTALLAPGGNQSGDANDDGGIFVAKPNNGYDAVQGTSFASPITAAAFAVIREKAPDASVEGILQGLKDTGVSITEDRSGYTAIQHKRIDIGAALEVADTFAKFEAPEEQPPTNPETPTDEPTDWVPGVPNAGSVARIRSIAVIVMCAVLLLAINATSLARRKRSGAL